MDPTVKNKSRKEIHSLMIRVSFLSDGFNTTTRSSGHTTVYSTNTVVYVDGFVKELEEDIRRKPKESSPSY